MGFFSDFAEVCNTISYATFDTLIYEATEQSNKVSEKYQKRLSDPNFKTAREVHRIMMSSTAEARKAFHISVADTSKSEAKSTQTTAKKPRKQPQSQQSN